MRPLDCCFDCLQIYDSVALFLFHSSPTKTAPEKQRSGQISSKYLQQKLEVDTSGSSVYYCSQVRMDNNTKQRWRTLDGNDQMSRRTFHPLSCTVSTTPRHDALKPKMPPQLYNTTSTIPACPNSPYSPVEKTTLSIHLLQEEFPKFGTTQHMCVSVDHGTTEQACWAGPHARYKSMEQSAGDSRARRNHCQQSSLDDEEKLLICRRKDENIPGSTKTKITKFDHKIAALGPDFLTERSDPDWVSRAIKAVKYICSLYQKTITLGDKA